MKKISDISLKKSTLKKEVQSRILKNCIDAAHSSDVAAGSPKKAFAVRRIVIFASLAVLFTLLIAVPLAVSKPDDTIPHVLHPKTTESAAEASSSRTPAGTSALPSGTFTSPSSVISGTESTETYQTTLSDATSATAQDITSTAKEVPDTTEKTIPASTKAPVVTTATDTAASDPSVTATQITDTWTQVTYTEAQQTTEPRFTSTEITETQQITDVKTTATDISETQFTETSPVVTETVPTETEMTVPAQRKDTFCFNSYEELACWMGEEENDERDDPAHGEYFSEYIDEIKDGESHIVFPLYNGETAALKSADGEAPIKLMVSEQYNIPWIQYTAEINGRITVIKCACLTGSDKPALKNRFASEVITALEFDTVDMYGSSTAESCFNISDVKMKYDNETVYALLSVYMESGRISLQFACGETLLTMTGSSEALNDSVTKDMSLYDVTLFS